MKTEIQNFLAATVLSTFSNQLQAHQNILPKEPSTDTVKNVVVVHGAFADASGWRGVYDELVARGYSVKLVQNPTTSLADDVAATLRVLKRQQGPTILVGHSYGGTVITEVGLDPRVAGLVYVAALAPDVGESTGDQFTEIPAPPGFIIEAQSDGFGFVNEDNFKTGFAGDVSEEDVAFLRDSQVAVAMSAFSDKVSHAAWRQKPSWFVVATQDGAIEPELQRKTASKIGAIIKEVVGSHAVYLSQPKAVADVIDRAAREAVFLTK